MPGLPKPEELAAAMAYVGDMSNPADKRAKVQATLDALPAFDMKLPPAGGAPKVPAQPAPDAAPPEPAGESPEQTRARREADDAKKMAGNKLDTSDTSPLAAFTTMLPRGMLFNWNDELAQVKNAGDFPGMEGLSTPTREVPTIDPGGSFEIQRAQSKAEEDQPGWSKAGELTGNAIGAIPAAFAGAAALGTSAGFMPARMLMGGIEGAGLGSANASGAAPEGQKEDAAIGGIATGGLPGFLMPPMLEPLLGPVANALGKGANYLRGFGSGIGREATRAVRDRGPEAITNFGRDIEATGLAGPGSEGLLPRTPGRMLPVAEKAMQTAGADIEQIGNELQGPPDMPAPVRPNSTGGFRSPTAEGGGSALARDENAFAGARGPAAPRGDVIPPSPLEYPALEANAPSRTGDIIPPAPAAVAPRRGNRLGDPQGGTSSSRLRRAEPRQPEGALPNLGSPEGDWWAPESPPMQGPEPSSTALTFGKNPQRYSRKVGPLDGPPPAEGAGFGEEQGSDSLALNQEEPGGFKPSGGGRRGSATPFADIEDAVLADQPRPGITVDLGRVADSLRQDAQDLGSLPLEEAKRQARGLEVDVANLENNRFSDYKTAHRLRQKLDSLGFNASGQGQSEAAGLYRKMAAQVNQAIDDAAHLEQPDVAKRLLDANKRYSVAADAYHYGAHGYTEAGRSLAHFNPAPMLGQNATAATARGLREAENVTRAVPDYAPAAMGAMTGNVPWLFDTNQSQEK